MLSKELENEIIKIKRRINDEVDEHFKGLREQRDVMNVNLIEIEIKCEGGDIDVNSRTDVQDLYEYINNK